MEESKLVLIGLFIAGILLLLVIVRVVKGVLLVRGSGKSNLDENQGERLESAQPHMLLFFIITFVAGVILSTYYYSKNFLPSPVSEPATHVVPLFNVTTLFTGVAFFITQILLFFFAFRYRTTPARKAKHLTNFLTLELFWIALPAAVFLFLFIWGQVLWNKIAIKPDMKDALEIEVMGEQFNWWVRYPGSDGKLGRSGFKFIDRVNVMGVDQQDQNSADDFIPVQMHVPKGRHIQLRLRSRDVIHSFFLPYFRTKMDAVPGMVTYMYFTPMVSTQEMRERLNNPAFNYEVACAELCGRMHFGMKFILVVDEPEQFEKWCSEQKSWMASRRELTADAHEH